MDKARTPPNPLAAETPEFGAWWRDFDPGGLLNRNLGRTAWNASRLNAPAVDARAAAEEIYELASQDSGTALDCGLVEQFAATISRHSPAPAVLSDPKLERELKDMAAFYMERPRAPDNGPLRMAEMSDRECKAVALLLLRAAAALGATK